MIRIEDPYLRRLAQVESGNNPLAKNPNSSAGGLFQFIDSTAKQYGLTDRYDAEQSLTAVTKFTEDNKKVLRKRLGREPSPGELYLAHQQGATGAANILSNPTATAADIVGGRAISLNAGGQGITAQDFANQWTGKFEQGMDRPLLAQNTVGQETLSDALTPAEEAELAAYEAADAGNEQPLSPEEEAELAAYEAADAGGAPKSTNYTGQGVLMGATDPVYGIGQIVPRGLSAVTSLGGLAPNPVSRAYDRSADRIDQRVQVREDEYTAGRGADSFDWGRLTGNIASPVNLLGAGAAAKAAQAATLGGKVAGGAAIGAGYSASAPVFNPEEFTKEKATQMGFGAAGGAVAPVVGKAIGRVLNPQTDKGVKALLKEGVKLTPGEMVGGAVKRGEDLLTSVPFLGSVIKGGQRRSIESLNKAAMNRALNPIGETLPKSVRLGRDAVEYVNSTLDQKYDDLLPKLTGKLDQTFADDMDNLDSMVGLDHIMSRAGKSQYKKIMRDVVRNRFSKTGSVTGNGVKEIESQLGNLISTLRKSNTTSDTQLADALASAQDALRKMLERNNPVHAAELKALNKGYANFKRLQRAASSVAANEGIFTPAQLQNAVKALDRSKDKSAFAKGTALMQDLTDPAKSRMAQSVPNSATVDRAMAASLFGVLATGASGVASAAAVAPTALLGLLAAGGYVPGGRRIAQALLTERPGAVRAVGDAASKYTPYLTAPLAASIVREKKE